MMFLSSLQVKPRVERTWHESIGAGEEVILERVSTHAGWAVHSGIESETPQFVAFFAGGEDAKRRAEKLLNSRRLITGDLDTEHETEPEVFDGGVTPAVLYGGVDATQDYGVFCANDYRDEVAIKALADHFLIEAEDWTR